MTRTWTISELATAAAAALDSEPVQVNGRTRDLPSERLIRWYTTIGLVDPPLTRRGRTARYGERHLLQLVAVKRRQAAGRTIAEIQVELAGATDSVLREIARLPDRPEAPSRDAAPARPPSPPSREPGSASITETPQDLATESAHASALHDAPRDPGDPDAPAPRGRFWAVPPKTPEAAADIGYGPPVEVDLAPPEPLQAVRLAPGVTLLLDVDRLDAEDLAAIGTAAQPLVAELHRRGLAPAVPHGPASPTHPPGSTS